MLTICGKTTASLWISGDTITFSFIGIPPIPFIDF